ncbi:MAG: PD-(D/E)XK nuclease family protein, partial [Termitinemataceae bacterium]
TDEDYGCAPEKGENERNLSGLIHVPDSYLAEETRSRLEHHQPYKTQKEAWNRSSQLIAGTKSTPSLDIRLNDLTIQDLKDNIYQALTTKQDFREERSRGCKQNHLSPTDINDFIRCPYQWLLIRGLSISELEREIETIGQRDIGILYHKILQSFFTALTNQRLHMTNLPEYQDLMKQLVAREIADMRNQEGAFQESVYGMLHNRIEQAMLDFLLTALGTPQKGIRDAAQTYLDNCVVIGSEYPLTYNYPTFGITLAGISDLILQDSTGNILILDFKTNTLPTTGELLPNQEGRLGNYQMISYIRMAESQLKKPVSRAAFYSIDQRKLFEVLSPKGISLQTAQERNKSRLPVTRDSIETLVTDILEQQIKEIIDFLRKGCYPVPKLEDRDVCSTCQVKSVCRITFTGGEIE